LEAAADAGIVIAHMSGMNLTIPRERRRYADRRDAGRALAGLLGDFQGREDVVVVGLPRGGVPVASEVARILEAPLDVSMVRKVHIAGHPDCAMGAIAGEGIFVRDDQVVRWYRIPPGIVDQAARAEEMELERRRRAYRGLRRSVPLQGRVVILVDDGLVTGVTMAAAAMAVRRLRPARIVAAVPVAASGRPRTVDHWVDAVVVGFVSDGFQRIAQSYESFGQTGDDEVAHLLAASGRERRPFRSMPPLTSAAELKAGIVAAA
jgi:predicted phosphoribosyltransferase